MWNFNKLSNLSGVVVIKCTVTSSTISFHIQPRRKTGVCPHCGKKTKQIKSKAPMKVIQNGMILGKICLLQVRLRRFFCENCARAFTEELLNVGKRQRVTLQHKREVVGNLSHSSFSSGSKKYHVSYFTQRRWLEELVTNQVCNFTQEEEENAPFVMGIDEVSFSGHTMLTTIGNITKHRLKGVLTSKNKRVLRSMLSHLSPHTKSLVSEVVIDMCRLYKTVVSEILPSASIVVDHFHIIHDANKRIDEQRTILQDIFKKRIPRYLFTMNKEDLKRYAADDLAQILKKYPELTLYYQTKERLRDMYKAKTKEQAEQELHLIISTLSSTDDGALIAWGRTLSYWKTYILNYWNSRSTNGYMEGMHNKMKLIKRISFGFRNKKVFIHKVMLSALITTVLLPYLIS